ncbi:MAG: hypothetical protein DLM61_24040 [Pseudonocardiales bacterium]|nr:MAG: hypothetical protein DLM61_24040 [Pseudonocardiales bacterium]
MKPAQEFPTPTKREWVRTAPGPYPIWVGIWGLLGLAHHRVPLTGQARPSARLQVAKLDDLPQDLSAMGEYPSGIRARDARPYTGAGLLV